MPRVSIPEVDEFAVPPLHIDGDHVVDVREDVQLHSVAPVDAGRNLAIDLAPRATDLRMQITLQRLQVFIEPAAPVPGADAEKHGSVELIAAAGGVRIPCLAGARPLYDHLVH